MTLSTHERLEVREALDDVNAIEHGLRLAASDDMDPNVRTALARLAGRLASRTYNALIDTFPE